MPPIEGPWAKLLRDPETRALTAALPLADHGLDVAAAMAALLAGGAWARALEQTAGRPLTPQDHARLIVFAALHDIGKANAGFQARSRKGAEKIGHEGQVAALLFHQRLGATEAGLALRAIAREWAAVQHLAALMAHHGRPRVEFAMPTPATPAWDRHVNLWNASDAYDPAAEAARLIAQVRARWPLAWEAGETLPQSPRFVSLFAGLMTLADWLGSDTKRFPVDGPHGAARDAVRAHEAGESVAARGLLPLATPDATFEGVFGFPPSGVQAQADADDLGPVALIEAETGSGKTEAALWRWLRMRRADEVDGLYFALPTRSAAVQLHERVQAMLDRLWGKGTIEAVLAVPGYLRAGDAEGQALPGWNVRWDDGDTDTRWAAERGNRYLAARVAVGTIDQALRAALKVKHAHVRAATLARSLLVVDEVHASDAYMGGLLERLLDNHVAAGGRALLLSATLGADARRRFLRQPQEDLPAAVAQPYPALSGRGAPPRPAKSAATTTTTAGGTIAKTVRIEVAAIINDAPAIAERAVTAARAGASVLVVRNSVGGAVAVAQAVEALAPDLAFCVNGVATLHHGRFAPSDRRLLDAEVERTFGKGRSAVGRVLVGTQTLEQSLDIDADLLLTDLAPIDVLLQRIGRLHRHRRDDRGAFAEARAIVLRPSERDLTPLLGTVRDRHGLGPMKDGAGVYPNLLQIEATLRLLEANGTVTIPADNRRLVEGGLHPAVIDALASELGIAWRNHLASCNGIAWADRGTASDVSLDLGTAFRDLVFPDRGEVIATRLGDQSLLVDIPGGFPGPFGERVNRVAIPHWMAGGVTGRDLPELLGADGDGQRFGLGSRRYRYHRFGLEQMTASD